MPRKKKNKEKSEKSRGLFDHINHIRSIQSSDYFDTLNDAEKKTFNHYMICRFLSMDKSIIDEVSYISKYFNKIDSKNFYKLCCEIVPLKNRTFFSYVKGKKEDFSDELVSLLCKKFEVSSREAKEYLSYYTCNVHNRHELEKICKGFGLTDKEIKKLL